MNAAARARVLVVLLLAAGGLRCQGADAPAPAGGTGGGGGGAGGAPVDAGGGASGGGATGAADGGLLPGEPACVWPTPASDQTVSSTINVSGTMDGGMKRYIASSSLGDGSQSEGQKPVFQLANGATLQNVILGAPAADGIHCSGNCTLKNVWWEDVGEDALTSLGTSSSTMVSIDGGGAQHASDKIFQHNGAGTMSISNFCAFGFGKLYRSCGNCSKQYARHVVLQNIAVTLPGAELVGLNVNYMDTAQIRNVIVHGRQITPIVICDEFTGNTSGAEPPEVRSGPDGATCNYNATTDVITAP